MVIFFFTFPAYFPYPQGEDSLMKLSFASKMRKIDFLGVLLLLTSSFLLVTAIEEGGIQYSGKSAVMLTLLVLSIVLTFAVVGWSRYIETRKSTQELIMGFGYGMNLATIVMAAPLAFTPQDLGACASFLTAQFLKKHVRTNLSGGYGESVASAGDSLGVAVSNILNNHLTGRLV